jgi:3-oxoacyl-[acyl-carrier-protein] synthase II
MPTTWRGLLEGRSGVVPISRFDAQGFASRIAGEVQGFDPAALIGGKLARRTSRVTQMALVSALEAVGQAGLNMAEEDPYRVGSVVGVSGSALEGTSDAVIRLHERGPDAINPMTGMMVPPNLAAGQSAISLGARGPSFSIASACATGGHSIGEAFEMVRRGAADVMLAGSSEALVWPVALAGYAALGAQSKRNDEPQRASRPFDRDRDGFVLSEGAAVLVLESESHARGRGARVLAELAGYGATTDAFHPVAPLESGEAAARAMELAMCQAGVSPREVGYINAHGTSTERGDIAETRAIRRALGPAADEVWVSSTKSMTGHLVGAAGAVEAAVCVMVIREGCIPPTINLETPDPECDLDYVPLVARAGRVDVALSNSFGFGGQNSCLAFRAVA